MEIKVCVQCQTPLPVEKFKRRAFCCSASCERLRLHQKYRGENPASSYLCNTTTTGTINEFKVAIDLLRRGYQVFKAISPGAICDLMIYKDHQLVRVEVTTGSRVNGKLSHTKSHAKDKYDLLCVVVRDEIVYIPEVF